MRRGWRDGRRHSPETASVVLLENFVNGWLEIARRITLIIFFDRKSGFYPKVGLHNCKVGLHNCKVGLPWLFPAGRGGGERTAGGSLYSYIYYLLVIELCVNLKVSALLTQIYFAHSIALHARTRNFQGTFLMSQTKLW